MIKIKHLTHKPIIQKYETQRQEMIGITKQVEEILAQGIQPNKIGIIYKENKYGEELAQYFKLKKIPVLQQTQFEYSLNSICKKDHCCVKVFSF